MRVFLGIVYYKHGTKSNYLPFWLKWRCQDWSKGSWWCWTIVIGLGSKSKTSPVFHLQNYFHYLLVIKAWKGVLKNNFTSRLWKQRFFVFFLLVMVAKNQDKSSDCLSTVAHPPKGQISSWGCTLFSLLRSSAKGVFARPEMPPILQS